MKPWERQWSQAPWERDWGQATPPSATSEQQDMVDIPSRVAHGAMDPVTGLAQMVYNAVPDSVKNAGTAADKWLYSHTGGVLGADRPFNQKVVDEEKAYQAARKATGQSGVDWARMGGNVLSSTPLMLAGPEMAAASWPGRMAIGAAEGGAFGMTQPVTNGGDFWGEKGKQALVGSALGAAATPVGAAVGRMIKPKTSKEAQLLMQEGITPSPGQILGGSFKTVEEKARSLPIMGDLISSSHKRSIAELNRAAYNRALSPIGKSAKGFPVGREGVAMVKQTLGDAYDELLPKLTFQADQPFSQEIAKISGMIQSLPEAAQTRFNKVLQEQVVGKMTSSGRMSGEAFKQVEQELNRLAKRYRGDQSVDIQDVGHAIGEVLSSMRNTLTRSNPAQAKRLQAINNGYSNYAIIRDAGSRAGAEGGFSASQLAQAVRASDKSVGKGATATGRAKMQDLADAGKSTLAATVPNSGTADRMLVGGGALLGASLFSPKIVAGLLAGGIPYTRLGQKGLAALLTKRPEMAGLLSNAVRQASPLLGASATPPLLGP